MLLLFLKNESPNQFLVNNPNPMSSSDSSSDSSFFASSLGASSTAAAPPPAAAPPAATAPPAGIDDICAAPAAINSSIDFPASLPTTVEACSSSNPTPTLSMMAFKSELDGASFPPRTASM